MASNMLRFLKVEKNKYVESPIFLILLSGVHITISVSCFLKPQQGQKSLFSPEFNISEDVSNLGLLGAG